MREYLPLIIVFSIIGAFTVVFLAAYAALRRQKDDTKERHFSDREIVSRLMAYAKPYWKQFLLVFFIMIVFSFLFLASLYHTIMYFSTNFLK